MPIKRLTMVTNNKLEQIIIAIYCNKNHVNGFGTFIKNITSHREMQIKSTMRYHPTPVRTAIINKSPNNKGWQGCGDRGTLVGMQSGAATVENSMEFPQKTKNGPAF